MFHSKQDVDRHVKEVFENIKSEYQRNTKCYQIAKLYYKFKDYKTAIKYINRYILTTANSAAAHRLLGECYLGVNLKAKAIDSFKTSLELNGSQNELVLKICQLLMDPDVSAVTPRAAYWLERGRSLFPTNPIIFQLREHLVKLNLDGKQDNGQLEKLILSEVSARPSDVTVRIRLLNFFIDSKRFKIAYQHALEIEERNTFSNDLRWYDCLCNVVQAYEKANSGLGFGFFIKKLIFFEKRADLSMQEFQEEVKTLPECSSALFSFDQNLHSVSKMEVPQEEKYFFPEFMKHMRAQLSFHLATLALKRAKKEYGIWPKAFRTASPLLLLATENTMDLEEAWYSMWSTKNKLDREVKQLRKSAALRVSQSGHILRAWSQSKGPSFLEKVTQFCGGKWQNHVYQDVFYNKEHQQAISTSDFINDSFFTKVPMRLLSDSELSHFDEVSQSAYPDSLHHLVWLGLAYCNANGSLSHDFRCTTVPDLQFTVTNLSQTGPETLNQLDVDAFLYASVLCAKSALPATVSGDRPSRLPVSISEELCSPAQADWWVAVYKTYTNQNIENVADTRLKLRKGIEVIRVFGQHGMHIKVIVMLAKIFQERASNNKNPNELSGLEDRAYLYWTAAIPLLEKLEKNQQLREIPNRLFDYRGKDINMSEIKSHLETGRLFLGCRLMKQGRHEQAIDVFQSLKSPYATFYQALIYEKLASEEINHRPESITSENRSQHIILLTRARDALYLTLDRLRCPSVDPNHPLNSQLQNHLDQIEKQLATIDPDSNLNRNGDSQSDETDTAPGPLSPDVDENLDSSFNVYNTSNVMGIKNHLTPRSLRQNILEKRHSARYEARPSPERLDAQMRHLVHANSTGLQAVVDQLREMKSTMQIELKDLGCVTRDLLAEMKKFNDRLETLSKRAPEVLKPEEFFELREEDYEDISQLSQQYAPYQNFPLNRQMAGTQGTSTVTYGTPVPSPIPPVQPVIPNPENSLIPPTFYPGAHPVPPIDPSLLLYQSMGCYAPGMPPFGENQSMLDCRGAGIQKGVPFAKPFKMHDAVPVVSTKSQPPNVVITSSDTLPAFTSAGTPAMSVTVPPQHIRGLTPSSVTQKSSPGQVHPFQIQMPFEAQLVKESPTEKLNSLTPGNLSTGALQTALVSGVKPTPAEQTTVKDFTRTAPVIDKTPDKNVTPGRKLEVTSNVNGNQLFETKALLSVYDKHWRDEGKVVVKIFQDEKAGKARMLILAEQGFAVHADHYITSDIVIEPVSNELSWTWTATNIERTGLLNESRPRKFRVQFNTLDEGKDFKFAFNEGRRLSNPVSQNGEQKSTPSKDAKAKECVGCKARLEGPSEKCVTCQIKEKSNDKTNLGGFTFSSSPTIKPPTFTITEQKEKPKEPPKPKPFAAFSFSGPATTPSKTESQQTTNSSSSFSTFCAPGSGTASSLFAGVKTDPNSFKKSENFKDFEGKDSLVFGYLNKQKTSTNTQEKSKTSMKTGNDDKEDDEDEFVPTAEFKPVIDLPDLVDVKTGEEGDVVLHDQRASLLRFDTNLKEWKERGVGNIRVLLNEETGKVRLIMRREKILKVCCNHYLEDGMDFKRMTKSEKALTWCARDFSDGESKDEFFALKFPNPDAMVRFENAIRDAKKKMNEIRKEKATTTKETKEEKSKDLKPLSELFKPKAGSWECSACLIRNNETDTKCVSCETPKPGTEGATKEPTSGTGLGKGITFPATTTKFTFGIPQSTQPTTTTTAASVPGFNLKFGIPSTTTASTTATFGALPTTFSFKATTTASSIPSFTFGIPTTSVKSETNPSVNVFSLGGKPQTNTTTIASPRFSHSTPTTSVANTGATKPFTFDFSKSLDASKSSGVGASQMTTPIFGNLKPEGKEKFEFSLSNKESAPAKDTSPKRKAGGDGENSEESDGEAEEDNGDHIVVKPVVPLPDKVDPHTGEEDEEVLFEKRAKLFRFVDKEWKERGIGNIKILKHKTNHKIRLLMRRETILKICLNHYLTPEIEFESKDEKSWTWRAGDYSEGEIQYNMFAIRFRTPELAQEFKEAIDKIRNNESSSSTATNLKEKTKEPSAAMKNFTFSLANQTKSESPKSGQSGAGKEDLLVVFEKTVTPEEREKAMSLGLPPNFYSYLQAPDCPGCPGCDKEDTPPSDSSAKPTFATKPWGSLNFGRDDKLQGLGSFNFSGNQGIPVSVGSNITEQSQSNNDGEDADDDDDDDDEDDDENDEDDEEDDDDDDDEDDDDDDDDEEEDEDKIEEEDEDEDEARDYEGEKEEEEEEEEEQHEDYDE